ncbi:hypothetical protein BLOT_010392 [Blomia tropicalis]|nr:hypothetical protein BLOT_010392 [Blomia tropicalis]
MINQSSYLTILFVLIISFVPLVFNQRLTIGDGEGTNSKRLVQLETMVSYTPVVIVLSISSIVVFLVILHIIYIEWNSKLITRSSIASNNGANNDQIPFDVQGRARNGTNQSSSNMDMIPMILRREHRQPTNVPSISANLNPKDIRQTISPVTLQMKMVPHISSLIPEKFPNTSSNRFVTEARCVQLETLINLADEKSEESSEPSKQNLI